VAQAAPGKPFGSISIGLSKPWHVATTQPWGQTMNLWKRVLSSSQWQASHYTRKSSKVSYGLSLVIMNFSATLWGCHTGTVRLHVGSLIVKIAHHVPLEKGTRPFVWKSKGLRSGATRNAWMTPSAAMPFLLCLV
jgi:hypothetical protein